MEQAGNSTQYNKRKVVGMLLLNVDEYKAWNSNHFCNLKIQRFGLKRAHFGSYTSLSNVGIEKHINLLNVHFVQVF